MPNVFIYFLYILKTSSYASMFVSLNASVRQVIYRDKYFLLFLFLLTSVTSRNVKRQLQLISVMNNRGNDGRKMLKEEKTGSGICHETPPQRHKIIILFFHTTIRQMACRSDLYSYEVFRKLSRGIFQC